MKIKKVQDTLTRQLAIMLSMDPRAIDALTALDSLGVHSMVLVEMFVFIEKEFGVELMSTGLTREHLKNVQTLAEVILRNTRNG